MEIKLVDLKAQYLSIKTEIDQAISDCLINSTFIGGEKVKSFEENFASFCDANYCVSCANGTDALEIALKAVGINREDEVIVPAMTFIATAEAVTNSGGKIVFCDINSKTYNIDTEKLESLITAKTKAIIAVHLYGQMAAMDKLQKIKKQYNLTLIEDAAQAHGATFNRNPVGHYSDIATFSFYPGKNLGAYGDGGALITNNEPFYSEVKKIANHGRIIKYEHVLEGRNSRLDTLQASVLNVKLKYLKEWNEKRREIVKNYEEFLSDIPEITRPHQHPDSNSVYHLYVVKTIPESRNNLFNYLKSQGIYAGIHYPEALPNLKAYDYLGHHPEDFPVATQLAKQVISLPIYPELSIDKIEFICNSIKEFYQNN